MPPNSVRRQAVAMVLALLAISACQGGPTTIAKESPSASPSQGAALNYDNTLAVYDLRSGKLLTQRKFAVGSHQPQQAGQYIGWSLKHDLLYVLVSTAQGAEVDAVSPVDWSTVWRTRLEDTAGSVRALVVAPKTGRVLVLSDRAVAEGRPGFGPRSEPIATALEPATGRVLSAWTLENPDLSSHQPEDWQVLEALFLPDESQLLVSYHNQGLHFYKVSSSALTSLCPSTDCRSAHGHIAFWSGHVIVATGGPEIAEEDLGGAVVRTFDTRLDRNHLMAFAIDQSGGELYAVGDCNYVPGMTAVNLATGAVRVVQPQETLGKVCGRLVRYVGGLLLVGDPDLNEIDPGSGRIVRKLQNWAIDLVAV